MPNVFIIGATGYLGLPLAQSLVRSGNHTVYGLARSPSKASILAGNEIIPILGDASDPSSYLSLLHSAPIDIVVNCGTAFEHDELTLRTIRDFSRQRRATLAAEGYPTTAKTAYVNISGTWVHGSSSTGTTSDLQLPGTSLSRGQPSTITAWRPKYEQAVLAAQDHLEVAIVRPACVHGRASWLWEGVWGPLVKNLTAQREGSDRGKPVQVPLPADARPGLVHVDDAVSGIHTVVDRILGQGLGPWPVFDLVTEMLSIQVLLEAVKEVLGLEKELEFVGSGGNVLFEGIGTRQDLVAERARIVLGWEPKRRSFVRDAKVVVEAWKAAREEKKA